MRRLRDRWRALDPQDRWFALGALAAIAGLGLVWPPLALLSFSGVALLVSVALARQGRGTEGD